MKKQNQKGFTTLEMLLVVIILAAVGFTGYYVYNSKKQTDKILNSAQNETSAVKVTKKSSTTTNSKYFTISQWAVRAPYTGTLTLSYALGSGANSNVATFSSKELTAVDTSCSGRGGLITRYLGSADAAAFNDTGTTIAQFAAGQDASTYGHVGNYYYFFSHDQAACGSNVSATADLQQQTNTAVKSLVSGLQAIPQ